MLNQQIHDDLPEKEVRDFLAQHYGIGAEGEIPFIEAEIKRLQERLQKVKRDVAVQALIKEKGWEVFDISSEIEDYDETRYFNFVGTATEWDNLLATIVLARLDSKS